MARISPELGKNTMRIFLLFLVFFPLVGFSQLNCKTIKVAKGDSVRCFHQNGKVATITYPDRTWDRYTYTEIFDQYGNKVYTGSQGYRHGGGSLYLKYHSNGAVSSARSTFQPDGGIQYHDVTTYFNEDGTFLREEDNSLHTHHRVITIPEPHYTPPNDIKPVETKVVQPKVDSVRLMIRNTTGKKVQVLVNRKGSAERKLVKLGKKEVLLGSYLPLKNEQDPLKYFDLILIPGRKNENLQFVWKPEFLQEGTNRIILISL